MPRKNCLMGRLDKYNVDLKGLTASNASYSWTVDQEFFGIVDGEEVQRGKVNVGLTVTKQSGVYHLNFTVAGSVIVTCDRCLDDMSLDIENSGELKVKLGPDFADDGDIVVVPEDKGEVNVAWYIYEFIALAIPIKHVHAPGKCNKGMMEKLDEHSAEEGDENTVEDSGANDPRWDALNSLMESDNE